MVMVMFRKKKKKENGNYRGGYFTKSKYSIIDHYTVSL